MQFAPPSHNNLLNSAQKTFLISESSVDLLTSENPNGRQCLSDGTGNSLFTV